MNKLKPTTVKQLIRSNPEEAKTVPAEEPFLTIAEFFCDSIQGENFIGWPATGKSSTGIGGWYWRWPSKTMSGIAAENMLNCGIS